jgi:ATP-dependent RNA helicase DeaD
MRTESFRLTPPMVSLLEKEGITEATPVQKEIIPAIMDGKDVLAQSETGSGKTLSFAIPIIEMLKKRDGLRALVLVPTRELCIQVTKEFVKYSQGRHLGITSVYGGVSINNQIKKIELTNIIVATPGRLIDLMNRNNVSLELIQFVVLDEADRMLDMGFIRDIERIFRKIPAKRQTMMFSATVSKEIEQLSQRFLHSPKNVKLASTVKAEFLHQTYYETTPEKKLPLLIELLKRERDLALVFCNRKHYASKIAKGLMVHGVHARSLHGDLSQGQRERVTDEFRKKRFNVLVATDVAARGLHIDDITHVYNFEIPRDVESYTHRIGRTARAGQQGEAISLVATPEERKFFKSILFSYHGTITLKHADVTAFPASQTPAPSSKRTHTHAHPQRERETEKKSSNTWQGRNKRRSW